MEVIGLRTPNPAGYPQFLWDQFSYSKAQVTPIVRASNDNGVGRNADFRLINRYLW